jgi:DGQHR domain-containing protein
MATKQAATLQMPVIKGKVMGVVVYRGYAPLADLARISKADVFDQTTNPTGTQRDLSPKHARDAYEYAKNREFGFWPEVFLCARDKRVLSFEPTGTNGTFGVLSVDVERARRPDRITISRVDGNHRLHYASGGIEGYPEIRKSVSFCITQAITLEQEIELFRDINNNQRRMNTSHLDNIEVRLSKEEQLKKTDPALYIAEKLDSDPESPLYLRVHRGGRKGSPSNIPLRSLKSGIAYMFSRPTRLTALKDPDAQYKLIRTFFQALRDWEPKAWTDVGSYLLLRGAGLWGVCFIGAEIIDRVLSAGKFDKASMLSLLQSGGQWDWTNRGDFQGLSGRGGAVKIRDRVVAEIPDEKGVSLSDLYRQIMKE